LGVLEHFIEPRPIIPALCTRNSSVIVFFDHFPAAALSDLAQFSELIFDSLPVGANANLNCGSFVHGPPRYAPAS